MKTLRFILEKEFRQIFRDPSILRMIFVMPILQLIVLPIVANYEVKNVKIAVIDHDHSPISTRMINKLEAGGYFQLTGYCVGYKEALDYVEQEKADLILEIPTHFERDLVKESSAKLFVAVNAINGVKAGLGASYLSSLLRDYNSDIRIETFPTTKFSQTPQLNITYSNWYNPLMSYKLFMVPGILVVLMTMVGSFLTSLNIVKEKEIGTIEQINVTPIKKYHFILGKLIPFWILGMIVLTLGLAVARVVYGIIPVGNIGLLYAFSAVYLLAVLGLGLLVSTITQTQQQAMLIAFFLMMIFIMMSGLYTSIDSMPYWAQVVTWFNPVRYFIEVMRMVVIKGSGFADIAVNLGIIFIFGIVLNTWAIISYKKRS